jgi:GT2 family glycosyltransferase
MGDPAVRAVVKHGALGDDAGPETVVVDLPTARQLPLAAARNKGAHLALRAEAEVVIFLDVDCLASPGLIEGYLTAAAAGEDGLWCGPVAYLDPPGHAAGGYTAKEFEEAAPHPARPAPQPGELQRGHDPNLFWSLSFAVNARAWRRLGGFDEEFLGYGAEDTDLAHRAARLGLPLWWVGGALAFHQWHPVSDPPLEHLHDIVDNANRFRRRWGWFPMGSWLRDFEALGLVRRSADGQLTTRHARPG